MASVVSDETESESLDCPLCFEQFDTPRVLPCLHTFCEKCLNTHITSKTKDGSQFLCPICKIPTRPPDPKLSVEKWAAAFQLNNIILYVIAASDRGENTSDLCQPCKVQGNENKAEVWCKDCQEQLCSSCNGFHKAMKISRLHKTCSMDEKQENQQATIEFNFIQDCIRHHGQRIELFCTDHRELCCVLCFAATHRECKNIQGISEVAKEQTQQAVFENISKDMKEILEQFDKLATARSKNIKELNNEKEQIKRDMDAKVDNAILKINELRQKFKAETDRQYLQTKCYLEQNEKSLQSFVKNMTNSRKIFGHTEKNISPEQMFIMYENFRSQIMSHYQQLKSEIQNEMKEAHLVLKPSSFFEDFEKSLEFSLGNIEKITRTSVVYNDSVKKIDDVMKVIDIRTKMKSTTSAAQVHKADLLMSSVTFVKALTNQELGGNRHSAYYSSGTFLPDGRLLMVDRNNSQLVEMNDRYGIMNRYDINTNPKDVAAGSKNQELYVTVNDDQIYQCTLGAKLTVRAKFKGPSGTWGIAVGVDKIIVAADVALVILDLDGSMVRSIPSKARVDMFSFVAVSHSRNNIYHRDGNAIVCRSLDGTELFRYSHPELKTPRGIYLDVYNNVYIVSNNPVKIHQVSADGKRSRILLNKLHGISNPLSAVFSSCRKEIIITSFNQATTFEVYKLK